MPSLDLKEALQGFFRSYLLEQKQASPCTVKSYRDALMLLLEFVRKEKGLSRMLKLTDLDVPLILDFLKSLEDVNSGRGNSAPTRNLRLAAIRSFFKYIAWQYPGLERQAKRIRGIPTKKSRTAKLDFLTHQELKALFAKVDPDEPEGFRDLALLTYLYNTGARSQEAADTKISWFDFSNRVVTITGKGNKDGEVPLWPCTVQALQTYIAQYRRRPKPSSQDFFFINQRGGHLTRFGVRRIVKKYIHRAKAQCESLRSKRLSSHSIRHTTAMHLLESGTELVVIQAWLRHKNLNSTGRYLEGDLNRKKEALEKFGPPIYVASALEPKAPNTTGQLLDWLKDL